jgi:phenylpropionate dioxygenase-like ring-hydroxylating dioxygenase large terminal subunit
MNDETAGWYAVLRVEEAVPRHIAFVRLFDEEIALWRADDGSVHAWENRCPHRGMRLTLGTNTGTELKCRYHGWRFAGETGACTFIPAHPEQTPPRAAVVRSYQSAERYGLIWIARGAVESEPDVPGLHGPPVITVRSVTMHAPHREVAAALAAEAPPASTRYLLQPQSAGVTTVHGIVAADVGAGERLALLREHNARLTALRRNLESGVAVSA